MGIEEHKDLLRRYFVEHAEEKDPAIVDECCTVDYVNHTAPPGVAGDREGTKQLYAMYNAALPDWSVEIEDVLAERDLAALRWTLHGTHGGELMEIPPTGTEVSIGGIFLARCREGRIAESWEHADMLGLLQQIGAAPAPEDADPTPWAPRVERPPVPDASAEETRAVIERFDKVAYQTDDLDAVGALVAEDFAHHAPVPVPPGRDGFLEFLAGLHAAFPDATSTTHHSIVEGEKALLHYTFTGTHQGEFAGVSATGNRVEMSGLSVYRVADGRVTDEWSMPDIAGMMEQLGVTD